MASRMTEISRQFAISISCLYMLEFVVISSAEGGPPGQPGPHCIKDDNNCCSETVNEDKLNCSVSEFPCQGKPIACEKIIADKIAGIGDGGNFFLWTDKEIEKRNFTTTINFQMDLMSLTDLSHDGILTVGMQLYLSWENPILAWDETRRDCFNKTPKVSTNHCKFQSDFSLSIFSNTLMIIVLEFITI